nr:MAG TPA: hypothetical protein [Bacteriophage sp.]
MKSSLNHKAPKGAFFITIFKERFKVFCFVVINLAKTKYLVNGLFSKI